MQSDYCISEIEMDHLAEALALVWKVFLTFEAPDYNEQGVLEFKSFIEYESIQQKLLQGTFHLWTCSSGEKIIGVLATRPPCHISLLFVDAEHHRKGIARALVETMIDTCGSRSECSEITVNSSPYAQQAYRHLGFTDTDSEQTVHGIRFIPMRRPIGYSSKGLCQTECQNPLAVTDE